MAVDRATRAVTLLSDEVLGSQLAPPVASCCRDRRRFRTRVATVTNAPPTIARVAGSGRPLVDAESSRFVLTRLARVISAAAIPTASVVAANSRNVRREKLRKLFTSPEFRLRLMHAQVPRVLEDLWATSGHTYPYRNGAITMSQFGGSRPQGYPPARAVSPAPSGRRLAVEIAADDE